MAFHVIDSRGIQLESIVVVSLLNIDASLFESLPILHYKPIYESGGKEVQGCFMRIQGDTRSEQNVVPHSPLSVFDDCFVTNTIECFFLQEKVWTPNNTISLINFPYLKRVILCHEGLLKTKLIHIKKCPSLLSIEIGCASSHFDGASFWVDRCNQLKSIIIEWALDTFNTIRFSSMFSCW